MGKGIGRIFTLAAVIIGTVCAGTAQADRLNLGATLYANSATLGENDPSGGTVVASSTSPTVVLTNATHNLQFQLLCQVIVGDSSNELGGLTFTYQLINTTPLSSLASAIQRLTVSKGFADFTIDASYKETLASDILPSRITRSGLTDDGDVIGFTFSPLDGGEGWVVKQTSSALLVVQTDATAYQIGSASVQTELGGWTGATYAPAAPIPLPPAAAMGGILLAGMAMGSRRLRRAFSC